MQVSLLAGTKVQRILNGNLLKNPFPVGQKGVSESMAYYERKKKSHAEVWKPEKAILVNWTNQSSLIMITILMHPDNTRHHHLVPVFYSSLWASTSSAYQKKRRKNPPSIILEGVQNHAYVMNLPERGHHLWRVNISSCCAYCTYDSTSQVQTCWLAESYCGLLFNSYFFFWLMVLNQTSVAMVQTLIS